MSARKLTGNCEDDCQEQCAYPGQFSECAVGALEDPTRTAEGTA